MAIKRKKLIRSQKTTPSNAFLAQYLELNGVIKMANKKIELLADAYVKRYCQYQPGEKIIIDNTVKPGYAYLIIEKIRPLVMQRGKPVNGKQAYDITFSFQGEFIPIEAGGAGYVEGLKAEKGYLNMNPDGKGKKSEASEKAGA